MLERYFIKPRTLARIRDSWLAAPIERYVGWLAGKGHAPSSVRRRVPFLMHFGVFARDNGARAWDELPALADGFVEHWIRTRHQRGGTVPACRREVGAARVPVERMLRLLDPGPAPPRQAPRPLPFAVTAPGFFACLREERGLRETSIELYARNLRRLESYLGGLGQRGFDALSPAVPSAFAVASGNTLCKGAMSVLRSRVRIFPSCLYREGQLSRDLAPSVDRPRMYRLSSVPRSISSGRSAAMR